MALPAQSRPGRGRERLRMTLAEYLAFEEISEEKHEYVDGWVSPVFPEIDGLAGGTNNHAALASNMGAILNRALTDSPCVVYGSDVRLQIETRSYRYPDIAVSCHSRDLEAGEQMNIRYPTLIVEVLSPGTEEVDRIDKLAEYRSLPSVQDYVLVNYSVRLAEHYHRAGDLWTYRGYGTGETIVLDALGVNLAIDQVYAKVRLPGDSPTLPRT